LSNGDIDVIVGTHALIEEDVQFNNLTLAIVDEQHRFGVLQRASLVKRVNFLILLFYQQLQFQELLL